MAPFKLNIQSRSGKVIATIEVDAEDTVRELKKKLHRTKKGLSPERQRLTLVPKPGEARGQVLEDNNKLSQYNLQDGSSVLFKDLGIQIGYSTVFFWEYFGPLAVYPLFYLLPQLFYPGYEMPPKRYPVQLVALAYWSFHYTKRILETFLVHKFGHATMPLFNLFKNCTYYWGFAAFVSYFVNHPLYSPPSETQTLVCFAAAMLCQFSNLWCHVLLAGLRTPGDKGYKIPRGFLFNYITCANYTMEIWGWYLFSLGVQALPAAIFSIAGAVQMTLWALQKHNRLRKLFDGKEGREKYPKRWVIFPPFF